MPNWRRITGAAGLVAGVAAAGAGAVAGAERIAASRLRGRPDPSASEPLGTLRGRPQPVVTGDGVRLHAEVDGPQDAPLTIVFCHGYTLNQDCWHFQRAALAGWRMVFWDQRDHGRSGRSARGSASVTQLGEDLQAVLAATVPPGGRVILAGHSMGGMTIMALAGQHPELFGTTVAGAVLISTCARGLNRGSPWMPGPIRPVLSRALPRVLSGAASGKRAALVEHSRRAWGDLALLGTRYIGFGDGEVSPSVVAFLENMIRNTPIEVVAQFGRALMECDLRDTLPVLGKVPVAVLVGDKDRLISPVLGLELATRIPGSRLVWVPGGGHALILERPALISGAIMDVAGRAASGAGERPAQPA
jgi:pimeloyl-ACP methyl ester carboxylesterase